MQTAAKNDSYIKKKQTNKKKNKRADIIVE